MKCKNQFAKLSIWSGLLVTLLALPFISADLGTFKQGDCVSLRVLSECSNVNLTEVTVGDTVFVINGVMTKLGGETFNYTFCNTSTTGVYTYSWDGDCDYCSDVGCGNSFEVTTQGLVKENSLLMTGIVMLVVLGVSLFMYTKISRFFGSMMIFMLGFGILFTLTEYGWLGWLVISSGFIMTLYSLLAPPKRRRH